MSKDIKVSIFVKPRRALNDVDFAAAIQSLSVGNFQALNNRDSVRNFTFGGNEYAIAVNGRHIQVFLSDVRAIFEENAHYERTEAELRKANQQFADEHVRLNSRIAEQAGVLEDNERRLKNQSISIGNFQAERGAYLQKAASDAEAMKILARQKGDAEEIVADLRAERARQDNVIASLRAQLSAKDSLLNAAGQDLEALRDERDQFVAARDEQRNMIIGFQQRSGAFDAEAARLREELAAERAERRTEAAAAAAEIESLKNVGGDMKATAVNLHDELHTLASQLRAANDNFRMADRALSARNDTIAAMDKLRDVREQEREAEEKRLLHIIGAKDIELARLRANVTHYACDAAKARSARVEPVRLAVLVHADGSVNVETEAPVVFTGNVSITGEVKQA